MSQKEIDIKRKILASALTSQRRSELTQEELKRQGERLRETIGETETIITQDTPRTQETVRAFERERNLTWRGKLMSCCRNCLSCCCCSKRLDTEGGREEIMELKERDSLLSSLRASTPVDDTESLVDTFAPDLDPLTKVADTSQEWKRTIATPIGLGKNHSTWTRQVDSCLSQLHRVNEEIGRDLDDQIALAQMLTVYLNFGADQVIGMNKKLNSKYLF